MRIMTKEQACNAAVYLVLKHAFPPAAHDPEGLTTAHLRWMSEQMPQLTEKKAMRWLGYIQGVMCAKRFETLDTLKRISKEASENKI